MIGQNRKRGAIGPEFAIASSAVLLIIVALIDYSTMFGDKHAINYGVVKAARYAALHSATATTSSITAIFNAVIAPVLGLDAQNCALSVSYPAGNTVGGTVVVSASYAWTSQSAIDQIPGIVLSASQTLTIEH